MDEQLYNKLAPWWPLMSPRETYAAEAEAYVQWMSQAAEGLLDSLLELGSASGHLASHLPDTLDVVLVDEAQAMLDQSRKLNPNRTHVCDDIRTVRLGRAFDAVLLHDAVMYMTTEDDLRAALQTAFAHLRPGGAFLVVPDVVREAFIEGTVSGGTEGEDGRAVQMLEWHWDPNPDDTTYQVEFAWLLRGTDGKVRCVHENHTLGLFDRQTWARLLYAVGFHLRTIDIVDKVDADYAFLAVRPTSS